MACWPCLLPLCISTAIVPFPLVIIKSQSNNANCEPDVFCTDNTCPRQPTAHPVNIFLTKNGFMVKKANKPFGVPFWNGMS
ncbi:unnamed protein product [Arctia plantaginis]|uniref:Uncharacterized protein n=1 Tax=Arctia plantaginis TaxID=874455 RepID=A0A8S1BNI1_ARCPL|nr:unnamed protein product [Arctia plantaginis]CAB3261931.1 unnamed protein product [Arctia plantaginis]